MKKRIGLFVLFVAVILCSAALADIKIDTKNFPDATFREYVKKFDKDGNGQFSEAELNAVTAIGVDYKDVKDFKGLEHFTKITYFSCKCVNNPLKSLDISKNTLLQKVYCSGNRITKLDVSNNPLLYDLDCSVTDITELNLSKNPALKYLLCDSAQLKKLDLSKNTQLIILSCSYVKHLTTLDLSRNTALERLNCVGCDISELLINSDVLYYITCYNNLPLKELDVGKCSILQELIKDSKPRQVTGTYYGWQKNIEGKQASLFVDKTLKVITGKKTAEIKITSISLDKNKATLKKGKTLQLKVKSILPADATNKKLKWTSSDKKIASVDKDGKVKAKKKGKCTITCIATDGSGIQATCKIIVK